VGACFNVRGSTTEPAGGAAANTAAVAAMARAIDRL
jgi:hypothetical protein